MRLAAVDLSAAHAGLHVGQTLSDARAMVTDLEVREIDRAYLEQVFADFADWHSNASPIVSVLSDHASYGDLILDITGVTHLFGGEEKMLAALTSRLEALGFAVAGAIAPSVGAAWALAHFAPGQIIEADAETALADLPVAALRLDEEQVAGLSQMGLKRVGQLYGRDRKALQARFGASLVTRLDQALGHLQERVTPRIPIAERYAERRYAEPIGLIDDVLMTTRDLAIQLSLRLEAEGLGAQSFHLFLYRVDHKVMSLSVNAARATRDAGHIARLFANRAERLVGEYDAGFGIDMIRLAASSVSEVNPAQIGAFETRDGAEDLDRLYDRMTSRLGPLAVVRSKFVNTHIPERAVKLEPVVASTPDDPEAKPDPTLPRPLRLLPAPEPIAVTLAEVPDGPPPGMIWRRVSYRFVKVSGPERIGVEWWTLAQPVPSTGDGGWSLEPGEEADFTRDYFIAEDEAGRRFWLFREGLYRQGISPRWFLHGFFA
jgi:protein ImuB